MEQLCYFLLNASWFIVSCIKKSGTIRAIRINTVSLLPISISGKLLFLAGEVNTRVLPRQMQVLLFILCVLASMLVSFLSLSQNVWDNIKMKIYFDLLLPKLLVRSHLLLSACGSTVYHGRSMWRRNPIYSLKIGKHNIQDGAGVPKISQDHGPLS